MTHEPDGPANDQSLIYAHSGTTLYLLDSTSFAVSQVAPFGGVQGSVTDIAVDKNGNMVGITLQRLYSIDSATGAASLIKNLTNDATGATSLSYIPSDLTDPNSADILVTANDQGDVFQLTISGSTLSTQQLGSYGTVALGKVVSSGDLIGVRGFGIYATVNVGSEPNDYLARIDPTTWKATPIGAGTGYQKIFGLGFWDGTIYGFVDDAAGTILSIDPNTGAATEVAHGTQAWYGAGVTTSAPIIGRTR